MKGLKDLGYRIKLFMLGVDRVGVGLSEHSWLNNNMSF
jgi:hypothetical protein